MEDVPENESTQTTDQILGFPDIEGEEDGGSEEASIEPVQVTRKSGRQRRLPQRFIDKEQIANMLDTDDDTVMEDVPLASSTQTTDQILGFADIEEEENGGSDKAANEAVQVPDVGPVTRMRGRPRKPQIVEKITNFIRKSKKK